MARLHESEDQIWVVLEELGPLGASDEAALEGLERGVPSENTVRPQLQRREWRSSREEVHIALKLRRRAALPES
jgi:hypothetical protein